MNALKFPSQKWTTFFYGMCSEDGLSKMIKDAEDEGCQFVQIMAGMIPPPPSAIALPGAKQNPIPVLRLLVRMPDEAYAELVKKHQAKAVSPLVN